ncbi:MAG TPA: alpha-amylase family protein [Vicinamibacterales bacterium]|nr:alpha-amylase family protein [Vicinamibacterales bacterium]
MDHDTTRRSWLKQAGAAGAGSLLAAAAHGQAALPAPRDGAILERTSTSGVFIPARGRSFQKFSFDFPEPSVALGGFEFGFRVFTHENIYGLDREAITVRSSAQGLDLVCSRFIWAGGQEKTAGTLAARLSVRADGIECTATVELDRPIKAVATIVRGIPRGRISAAGAAFFDPRNDELLFGYPFSGGDLFGPQENGSLTTPLMLVQPAEGAILALSSLDDRVRTKRFYFQPGDTAYRAELLVETEGWLETRSFHAPAWRIGRATSIGAAASAHYEHVQRAFRLPEWQDRADVPGWLRRTALVVTLHGMHYTGYIFNDYARMRAILQWMAPRIDPGRVLVFLAAWDGRYYWNYPVYQPDPRMGGAEGFGDLVKEAHGLGFRVMPMFGANAANRRQPAYAALAGAASAKIDGDPLDLNWVDWDNDRHQEGWLTYMNLGVESWRTWLTDRIAAIVDTYGVDAYFLDIAGGWVNNPKADMHEGLRRLVSDLHRRFPQLLACGEMHYDALLEFVPLYHSFGQTLVADQVQRYGRFFQHLSHPAPGRGSTGVHEAGFSRWDPQTLSLTDSTIPTLNVADDTFSAHQAEMAAVIERAKARAGI